MELACNNLPFSFSSRITSSWKSCVALQGFSTGVRRFIHNTKTNTFVAQDGTWTTDVDLAKEFVSDDDIRKARDDYELKDCELYYCLAKKPSRLDFGILLSRLK